MRCDEWKVVKLKDVCSIKYGKDHKKLNDGNIPAYGSGGLMRYVDSAIHNKKSVLIPRKGTLSNLFLVEPPFWTVDTLFWTDINLDLIIPDFLYYQLCIMDLASKNVGTAVPSLTTAILNELDVILPSIEEQKHLISILCSIERKIETNQKINDNLQQQAQAIYTSKFIDNANPAWEQGHLSDLIAVKYGKDHKKLEDGSYPVYGSGGIMRYVERPLYDKESVLIPRKGTLNNVMYVNQPFWSVDTMFYTEMRLSNVAKYVFHFVKSKDLASMNAGSAVPSMTTDILNAMEVVIPSASVLEEFEALVAPMYLTMQENDKQSETLAKLRDTLLPKLMSSEIDVSDISI